jgi:hypothetical protein
MSSHVGTNIYGFELTRLDQFSLDFTKPVIALHEINDGM